VSANDIWAIGGPQSPYSAIERFNGKIWYRAKAKGIPAGQWTFWGLRVVTDKDVWVTASLSTNNREVPFLLHYNGSSWTKIGSSAAAPLTDLLAIAQVPGTGTVWGAGFTEAKSGGGPPSSGLTVTSERSAGFLRWPGQSGM
jgi:hypothetical protein